MRPPFCCGRRRLWPSEAGEPGGGREPTRGGGGGGGARSSVPRDPVVAWRLSADYGTRAITTAQLLPALRLLQLLLLGLGRLRLVSLLVSYPYWFYPYLGYGGGYYRPWYDDLGSLRIEVKPREAQVYVDGYFAGLVDDFDGMSPAAPGQAGRAPDRGVHDGYPAAQREDAVPSGQHAEDEERRCSRWRAGEAQPPKPRAGCDRRRRPPRRIRRRPGPERRRRPYRPGPPAVVRPEPAPAAPPGEIRHRARAGYGTLSIRVQPRDAVVLDRW